MTPEQQEVEWRPIYNGKYLVSSDGRVQRRPGVDLRPHPGRGGYQRLTIRPDERQQSVFVHRLVALAFIGPRPEGMTINHKNGIKTDNSAANLEYVTPSQNTQHALSMGLLALGERQGNAKLTAEKVKAIRAAHAAGKSSRVLAAENGCSQATVMWILKGVTWKHVK